MYVSCSALCCHQPAYPTLDDALGKITALGFRAFDLDVFENWQHVTPSRLAADEAYLEETAETIRRSGLVVSSFNCGLSRSLGEPDAAEREAYGREFGALLILAEATGCPNITVQPGPARPNRPADAVLRAMADHLNELAEMSEDYDVTLGIEGHANGPIERTEAALELIEAVWPRVGYTYDPSHPELQGIPLAETEKLLPYTVHVHVRNASLGNMQDTMAAGTVQLAWVVDALSAHGYDGAVTIEYFNGYDPDFESVMQLRDGLLALGVEAGPEDD